MFKKYASVILSAAAFLFTVWYMHFAKPWTNDGALSTIGLDHRILFAIWGVLTFAALACGIAQAYIKLTRTKIYLPLLIISGAGMALTLACRFDYDIHHEYILHCIGSLTFSAVTGFTIFLLFLLNYKKHLLFKLFTCLTAAILLTDTVFLIIWKETGLIEAIPIFSGYIMLGITNLRGEALEATRKITAAR